MAAAGAAARLGTVHPARRTPWIAIIFTTAISFGSSPTSCCAATGSGADHPARRYDGSAAALCLHGRQHRAAGAAAATGRPRPLPRPDWLPWLGAASCAFLAGPWARSEAQREQYEIAGYLLVVGLILWAVTYLVTRGSEPPSEDSIEEDLARVVRSTNLPDTVLVPEQVADHATATAGALALGDRCPLGRLYDDETRAGERVLEGFP